MPLLGGCAASVAWEVEPAADLSSGRSYEWGGIEGAPSEVVGAEMRRVVARELCSRGFNSAAGSDLQVVVRFEPSPEPEERPLSPEPSGPGIFAAALLTMAFRAEPPRLSTSVPTQWSPQGQESLELTIRERTTNRLVCRGRTVLELRGFSDSSHVAAVRGAIGGLMAALPLRR